MVQLLTESIFLLSLPPFMMFSISLNSRNASKCPLRSLNHKISKLKPIYLMLSIQSEFLTPKKEVPEGRRLECTKSSGIIILRKKRLGRLKLISKEIFPTFLEPIQVPIFAPFSFCNLGTRFLLGGKAVTPRVFAQYFN